ncbi:15,16-dihydrobiliverdin:ferredoxin oxidoreductase [Prochlorococcus marinus]|uniref:15,16-dihydrobiliverdin:ferredoxin oxidoreductase n=1 Tax=Prochlorococcus marinus TaxID=1219 RepID=UPI0022B2ACE2|nr:15,16-dihydrobiliverdin:ferredoxin oxidoreductase [Prochlorococcus marinus]
MFDQLLKQLDKSILLHGGKSVDVPNGFEECFSKRKEAVIRSWLWDVPGFRRWRVTRMDAGEKLQVLNSVAYPEYINDQPILGMDLLWFGVKQKLVAVLDFQPLVQNDKYFLRYLQGLKSLKNDLKEFNQKHNMHIYDSNKFFSPWVLLYSGCSDSLKISLPNTLDLFLEMYWNINTNIVENYIPLSSTEVEYCHSNYDKYNAERDPAHGLFKSYFGEEWADEFVKNFLFPKSI